MSLYYMVKYERSIIKFQWKQCTEQLEEPHWTDTAQPFRDCYNNSINIENIHDLNDTDMPTEESRIESQTDPTSREATIATAEELQIEEQRQQLRKSTQFVIFTKKPLSTRHDR